MAEEQSGEYIEMSTETMKQHSEVEAGDNNGSTSDIKKPLMGPWAELKETLSTFRYSLSISHMKLMVIHTIHKYIHDALLDLV